VGAVISYTFVFVDVFIVLTSEYLLCIGDSDKNKGGSFKMETLIVQIDGVLKDRLKATAFERRMTMKALVVSALEQYMGGDATAVDGRGGHKHECLVCTKKWDSSKADPAVCPSCKSYDWKDGKAKGKRGQTVPGGLSARTMYVEFVRLFKSALMPMAEFAQLIGTSEDKLRPYFTQDQPVTQEQLDHIRGKLVEGGIK
jgi:hypothetical protein